MNREQVPSRPKPLAIFCSCIAFLLFSTCTAVFVPIVIFSPSLYRSLSSSYYAERANSNYNKLNFEDAISDYTRAIQLKPDYYDAYVYRGGAYAHLENYEKAKSDFEMAINLEPSQAKAYNSLCWFGSLLGNAPDVLEDCEKAVALEPNNPNYRDSRGLALALTGNYEGAIHDFQFYVDQANTDSHTSADIRERMMWISSLNAGIDPFDSAELRKLLENNSLQEELPQMDI